MIHTGAASVALGHGPPVECDSLILDVVVEIGLCKDVDTTVSDFLLFDQPESYLSISSRFKRMVARSNLSMTCILDPLPGAVPLVRLNGPKML